MSTPVDPCGVAADGLAPVSECPGVIDALARVLDPQAFEPSEHPRNVGFELQRADRRRTAVAHAVRAVAAGYRLAQGDSE